MRGPASKTQGRCCLRNDTQGSPLASINHLNYLEDGEKLAKQVVVRAEGWGKSYPKSRLKITNSRNSGNGGENSRISGHRVIPAFHQDVSYHTSWLLHDRSALPWISISLSTEPQFFCHFQEYRVRFVFIYRCQKTPDDLEQAMVSGSSLVSSSAR